MSSGGFSIKELRPHRVEVRRIISLGLRDVEDVHDSESTDLLQSLVFAIVGFDLRLVLARSQDGEPLLSFAYAAVQ